MKPTFSVRPVGGKYELRQLGVDAVTVMTDEESAIWGATAQSVLTGCEIIILDSTGKTVRIETIEPPPLKWF